MHHAPPFQLRFLAPRHWGTWLGVLLLRLVTLAPWRLRGWLADGLAWLAVRLPSRRRTVAMVNLELCFPEASKAERQRIMQESVRIKSHMFAGYGILLFGSINRLRKRFTVEGFEVCQEALDAGAKSLVILTPHWQCFEFGGQVMNSLNPLVSVVRLHEGNDMLDWLVTRMRTRGGARPFGHLAPLTGLVRAARGGAWVFYLPDEDAGSLAHSFEPFFGVPKATTEAFDRLVKACRAAVVPVSMAYDADTCCFRMRFHPPVDGRLSPAQMNAAMEKLIRIQPEQYDWTSKIFHTRPPGETNPYKAGKRKRA